MSQSTAAGCQNAPTRFFPSGRFTPVFPPTAASTWARSDVATFTYAVPRWYVAAANPATSVTRPPPTATTTSLRASPERAKDRQRSSTVARRFPVSPSGMVTTSNGSPGSRSSSQPASAMPAWVTTRRPTGRAQPVGQDPRQPVAHPGADRHLVAPVTELDRAGDHDGPVDPPEAVVSSSDPAVPSAATTASTTSSGSRSSTSTTAWATSA